MTESSRNLLVRSQVANITYRGTPREIVLTVLAALVVILFLSIVARAAWSQVRRRCCRTLRRNKSGSTTSPTKIQRNATDDTEEMGVSVTGEEGEEVDFSPLDFSSSDEQEV